MISVRHSGAVRVNFFQCIRTYIHTYIQKNIHLFLFIGGFITYAMEGVRSTNLIIYDGMVKHIHMYHTYYVHTYIHTVHC